MEPLIKQVTSSDPLEFCRRQHPPSLNIRMKKSKDGLFWVK